MIFATVIIKPRLHYELPSRLQESSTKRGCAGALAGNEIKFRNMIFCNCSQIESVGLSMRMKNRILEESHGMVQHACISHVRDYNLRSL